MSVFSMVAAGCVSNLEKGHGFMEFPHCGREWLVMRGDTFWPAARYAEKNDKRPDVVCTADGEPRAVSDRDERPVPVRIRRAPAQLQTRTWLIMHSVASCVCGKGPMVCGQFMVFLGRAALILRHDSENAIKSFAKAVSNAREHEIQDESTQKHSSSS